MPGLEVITKRICELVVGDKFIMMGTKFKVIKIENERIYYCTLRDRTHIVDSGAKSQWMVEMIE